MKHATLGLLALAGACLTPLSSLAHEVSCTRGGLANAVEHYLEAQSSGNLAAMALPANVGYWENLQPGDINNSIVSKALKIDHHMSIYDEDNCSTFTEVIVTNAAEPYVIGTRLRVNHDRIAEVETLWTTTGYWLFDADAYLKYSSTENWGPLPVEQRSSRGTLVKAANAYLDAFLEGKIDDVPWGFPCVRVEGGAYTGKGSPDDSCEVGVPAGVNISNRRFVVDEVTGTVAVFCTFGTGGSGGGSSAPDTHLFRVENGKLRYVHTLTHMLQSSFRGNTSN
jgi:hypothetical protein